MYIFEKSKDGKLKKLLNFIDEVTKDENFKNNGRFCKIFSKNILVLLITLKEWLPIMIALIIITLILIIIYFIRKYKDILKL